MVGIVAPLADAFTARGHRLYLVGGVVRDLLLGSFSGHDDIDLTTDAEPARIKALLRPLATDVWVQGERFGTIGARVGGRSLEVTTHRAEAYDPSSRKPVVHFGHSIDDDLSRRDFTINAIALSLPDRTLIDPYGGADDLSRRVLRTPLSPAESFGDDPLRMLRAARFLPRFDLEVEPGLEAAATELAGRLAIVSVERVRDELERLLGLPDPTRGLAFLERTGLLSQAVPALAARPTAAADAARLAAGPGSVAVRRAGLLAPLGPGAEAALRGLRHANAEVDGTLRLLAALPAALDPAPDAASVRRTVDRLGAARLGDLAQLAGNVTTLGAGALLPPGPGPGSGSGSGSEPGSEPGSGEAARPGAGGGLPFFRLAAELAEREDLADLAPPLTGRQVMDHLGLEPGPEVGRLLGLLRRHRLENGPFSEAEARALLDRWRA